MMLTRWWVRRKDLMESRPYTAEGDYFNQVVKADDVVVLEARLWKTECLGCGCGTNKTEQVCKLEQQVAALEGLIEAEQSRFASMRDSMVIVNQDVQAKLQQAEAERDELQTLFDMQHTRTQIADKLWQDAHGKPDTLPDLGNLIDWLLTKEYLNG